MDQANAAAVFQLATAIGSALNAWRDNGGEPDEDQRIVFKIEGQQATFEGFDFVGENAGADSGPWTAYVTVRVTPQP